MKLTRVLLVDDHPIIVESYRNSIKAYEFQNKGHEFTVDSALGCESALVLINKKEYDIAFLDIRLPASKDGKYKCGEDLAKLIKSKHEATKIIIITGHYDALLLGKLLQNLNPDGLLFKGDVGSQMVSNALTSVLTNYPFYSPTVLNLLRKKMSSDIVLNKNDKLLLYELAKGTKTKDLIKCLPLSIGGVESRKRYLKGLFETKGKDDSELIIAAKKKGFI
ncbi:response regulator transcription factor [Subsaximicrobium wynnwilliamsii]|uniref:Response regulator transcription factor n=1 Tax=Subsaximicrobium wynnwilliamsii TaxID=291179 RepID=A0A5C6ZHM7_9FLAO|nr:response regulator [Subsaximicrobium wynnwilliamsii]TXD83467.1 response regulator transcription factor [Subsaximicrobium wynnwilliamsii]TXD89258.1 response regulator transcription factor [Subsaximicrobium wynnwilliamsii]TXE03147.1 response regulator transcription factor [Subsaximicrobium wynnwilliamsii]